MLYFAGRMALLLGGLMFGLILVCRMIAPSLPSQGQLVYVVSLSSDLQLFTTDLSRNLTVRLLTSIHNDYQPTLATTTREIVFVSDRDGDSDLYAMSADGRNFRQLTHNSYDDLAPQWSPDGTTILYQSNPNRNSQLYLMSPQGTDIRQLTQLSRAVARPAWSPDGNSVTYDSEGEIYIYNLADSTSQRLTTDSAWDQQPLWTQDGTAILYESYRGRFWYLYRVAVENGTPYRIATAEASDQHVALFGEDNRIVFQSTRNYPLRLYSLDLDRPETITPIPIPPESTMSLYALFGVQDDYIARWTDILQPVWVGWN